MLTVKHSFRVNGLCFSHKTTVNPYKNDPTAHGYWELILVKSGDIIYTVNGKKYHPGKNSLIITRPLDYHSLSFESDETYERHLINFDESLMFTDVCQKVPQNVEVVDLNGNEMVCDLFRKLGNYVDQFDKETAKALAIHLIEEILYNVILITQMPKKKEETSANPLIYRAVQYINENITRPMTMDEIAEQLCITRGHMRRLFVSHMNITPKQFVLSQKLLMARKDLCAGSKATEVCTKYGFPDYSSFYRHYLHYFGHKPSDPVSLVIYEDNDF